MAPSLSAPHGVEVLARLPPDRAWVLSPEALAFLADLQRRFRSERAALLQARDERHGRLAAGELPDFPAETADIRASDWRVAPTPPDLDDRRGEITGPAEPR